MKKRPLIFAFTCLLAITFCSQLPLFAGKRNEKNRHETQYKKKSASASSSRHPKKRKTKCVSNDLKVCGGLEVGGNTVLDQTLIVTGNGYLGADLNVNGNTSLDGNLNLLGNETIGGNLQVDGNGTFEGDLGLTGNEFVQGSLTVNGAIYQKPVRKWETGAFWHRGDFVEERYLTVASQDIALQESPSPTRNGSISLAPGYVISPQMIPQSNPVAGLESQVLQLTITNVAITSTTVTFTVASTTGVASNDVLVVSGFTGANAFLNNTYPATGTSLTITPTTIAFSNEFGYLAQTISATGLIEIAKPSGTFFTEELWLVNYPAMYNNCVVMRVASVAPDGKSFTTSSMWLPQGDGGSNWPDFSPTTAAVLTTIASTSNGLTLPQTNIDVASASAFATSGTLMITTSQGLQQVTYTGKSGNTFTGCSGGIGILSTGASVAALPNTSEMWRLIRVRLNPMFATWVGNMDHLGNAVVRAKMAVNRNKNFQMYLLLAELQEDNTWKVVTPSTDGPNLRHVDEYGLAKWELSGLKLGTKYTALAIIPTNSLIQLINIGELDFNSTLFRNQLQNGVSSFSTTVFQMPYPADSDADITLAVTSCYFAQQEVGFNLLKNKNYDFLISTGDTIYGDYGGNSLLSFTFPNNAGSALGFGAQAYMIWPQYYNIGTASQTGTTITGVGTAFSSSMNPGIILFQDSTTAVINGFVNATTLTTIQSQSVASQPYTIYFGAGLLRAPNALTTPLTINSSNNLLAMNDVLYTLPSGTYATPQAVASMLTTVLGSKYQVFVDGSNRLIINEPTWNGYGYSQQYTNLFKGTYFADTISNMGMYAVTDDHEVTNNYFYLTAIAQNQQASPTEATIAQTMNTNPQAILYGVNLQKSGATLSANPTPAIPVLNPSIDTAIHEFDRYMPGKFVGTVDSNNRQGFVRWGQVELIILSSIPYRDPSGNYIYYDTLNEFMRQDQLDFLIDRLTNSDAKVKLVLYSRALDAGFYNQSDFDEMKDKYVSIATNIGFNQTDAESTFDKLFRFSSTGFSTAFLEPVAPNNAWLTDVFIPALESTGAKNVYFLAGGAHYSYIDRLVEGSPYISIQTAGVGSVADGNVPLAAKYGINPQIIAYEKGRGCIDITVSPKRGKIIVSLLNTEGLENVTEFDIVD